VANEEHVRILWHGVEVWNKWREENPEVRPDLRVVNVGSKKFKGTPLWDEKRGSANLYGANLRYAKLDLAIVSESDLSWANLRYAKLRKVDLSGTNLSGADLSGADLCRADLCRANLCGANFDKTDVKSVKFDTEHYDMNKLNRYRGINAATCYGNPMFKKYVEDQAFLEELYAKWKGTWREWVYLKPWKWTCDYGRSVGRWIGWSVGLAFVFGLVYTLMGESSFHISSDGLASDGYPSGVTKLFIMLYYSIVTFTTLGFGDVVPKTGCAAGLVTLEVVISIPRYTME